MISVIIPTRGRPHVVQELARSFADTCTGDTELVLSIDSDDPTLPEYAEAVDNLDVFADSVFIDEVAGGWMVAALNETARRVVQDPHVEAVGFLGDDHRPRTLGWDTAYLEALREMGAGIVYGNDMLQYDFVPTQCAMTADIVRRLGWMAHPSLKHMYVDTLWRDMAKPVGKLRYLPDVTVEHLHYLNNKATEDEGYKRVNDPTVYSADEQAFRQLHANGTVTMAGAMIQTCAAVNLARR